jgi:hypothetical protein
MGLILGMDIWVFSAWLLTILSAILCVIYGVYYEFIKKNTDETKKKPEKEDK